MQLHIHKDIKIWIQKSATWLAIFAIVLPVNILSAIKVEAANQGDVMITEFMANPDLVSDTNGEWLEVQNTTMSPITDFSSWKIGSVSITGSATIEPGKSAVVCKNGTVSTNGGVKCDFTSAFSLAQSPSTDYQIIIKDGSDNTIRTLDYNGSDITTGKSRYANGSDETVNQYGAGDYGTPNSNSVAIGNHSYPTIQTAIDGASSGDTINIAAGTYVESPSVTKPLTITGAGQSLTTIAPTENSNGISILENNVTVQNLKVQTTNSTPTPNIAVKISATSGVTLTSNTISTTGDKAMGVWVGGSSDSISPSAGLTIIKNTINIAGRATGIYASHSSPAHSGWVIGGSLANKNIITMGSANPVELYDVTDSEVSYNDFNITSPSDVSNVIWSGELSNLSNLTLKYNNINGSTGSEVAFTNNSITGSGSTITTATITNNTFQNWGSRSLRIGAGVSGVSANNNQFLLGSQTEVLKNESTSSVNAENNWWGNADPVFATIIVIGSGAGAVDSSPWWTTSTGTPSAIPDVTSTELTTTNDNTPTFAWTLSGAPTPTETITIDSGTPIALSSGATSYTPTTLTDGTHTWSVTATNSMGVNSSDTDSFIIDTTPPSGSSLSINSGVAFTSTPLVSLNINATDNFTPVQMQLSNAADMSADTDNPGSGSWIEYSERVSWVLGRDEGTHTVYAIFRDGGFNTTSVVTDSIVLDTVSPTLSVSAPIDGQVFKTTSPTATYSAIDTSSLTYEVRVDDVVVPGHISGAGASLGTLADGDHAVIIKVTDNAGNETSETRTITINSLLISEPLTTQFTGIQSDQTINDIANTGIELSGINTTGDVTISIGEYTSNPTSAGITGLQAFGKYFDVSVSDSTNVAFPMMVKIYYTNADLAGAGITEDKLDGIYFYSTVSGAWERYGDSGVQTADLVANGISFAGYVWANVNHLTPIVAASDTTAPVYPTNVTTLTGDSTLSLSWNAVSGASGYTIRWRPTTVSNTGGYTYATTTDTNYTITGLNNTWSYEVGVASADRHGNMSDYTVVSASPIPVIAPVVQETTSTPAVILASTPEITVTQTPVQPVVPKTTVVAPTSQAAPSDDAGAIKGSETQAESGSQTVVVFAILLLALAAGIGGYYGYEWFVQRSTPDGGPVFDAQKKGSGPNKTPSPRGRPKKNDTPRDGRW